jgi:hypothetical protein
MFKQLFPAAMTACVALLAGQAMAEELWDPHLRGVDEGLAAGALPPEGVYFINDSYFLPDGYVGDSKSTSTKLQSYVDVPILVWVPGIKLLGADYAVALAQPFDYTNLNVGNYEAGNHWGTFNTAIVPGILSWALPYDLHAKTQFSVYLNDGSSTYRSGNTPAAGVGAAMANYTFEPGVGLSWLHDGWNLSVQMLYDTSTADDRSAHPRCGATPCKYQSGDQLAFDYTITKTIKKWVVGVGAYENNQIQKDQVRGVSMPGTGAMSFAVGPIVGYNFGPLEVMATFNHQTVNHNDSAGDTVNFRVVVPLY